MNARNPIPLPDRTSAVLVLQGGGALGAYQAGVYEGLAEAGYLPEWVSGVSIGAINAALIMGNLPERRVERLRAFWKLVSSGALAIVPPAARTASESVRSMLARASAAVSATLGVPGFYSPRLPPSPLMPDGHPGALSVYDTEPLRATLEHLVDFDLINCGKGRLSVGAVNVVTGNSTYFDSVSTRIGPQHVMASGALPPGFAPVEIDGEYYWDGGLVSNAPLSYVLDHPPHEDALVFQVDLFSAKGALPRNLDQVMERHKDIMYSSKTRFNTTNFVELQRLRRALHRMRERLSAEIRSDPEMRAIDALCSDRRIDIVHLINRRYPFSSHTKDFEFLRASVDEHWQAGLEDFRRTVSHPEWLQGSTLADGIRVYDLAR